LNRREDKREEIVTGKRMGTEENLMRGFIEEKEDDAALEDRAFGRLGVWVLHSVQSRIVSPKSDTPVLVPCPKW